MENLKAILGHPNFPDIYHDTVMALVILVAVYILRNPIQGLIDRIASNTNPITGETSFHPVGPSKKPSKFKEKKEESTSPEEEPRVHVDYRVAHHYWIGSDLMQAVSSVAYVPDKETATGALRQSLRHFRKGGFSDPQIEERLQWIIELSEKKVLSEWKQDKFRKDLLNEILVARTMISKHIESVAGPEFKPWED